MPDSDALERNTSAAPRKLTNRQMTIVQELADGCDIATVAARRGRGVSSVYEIAVRICERWELSDWRAIGPYAVSHGLVDAHVEGTTTVQE